MLQVVRPREFSKTGKTRSGGSPSGEMTALAWLGLVLGCHFVAALLHR